MAVTMVEKWANRSAEKLVEKKVVQLDDLMVVLKAPMMAAT